MSDLHLSKTCSRCGITHPVSAFHRKAEMPDGYRGICKACTSRTGQDYRKRNPSKVAEAKKRWVRLNPEKSEAITLRYKERYQRMYSGYTAKVREQNPASYARMVAKWAKRRASRLRATPEWADEQKILSIYAQAERMRAAGFDVHVDHIYPLNGHLVCGQCL